METKKKRTDYRTINIRHFPNSLHAMLWSLKKETGKSIEELLVTAVEKGLGQIVIPKKQKKQETIDKPIIPIISKIKNDRAWPPSYSQIYGQAGISEDLCMPHGITALEEIP